MDEFKIFTVYATKIPKFKHKSFTSFESALEYFKENLPKSLSKDQVNYAAMAQFYSWVDGYKKPTLRIIESPLI